MQKRNRHIIENQSKVKVIAQADDHTADKVRFTVLAVFFAGIFYFFGNNLWLALTGG